MKYAKNVIQCLSILKEHPEVREPDTLLGRLECFFALIQDWNDFASLLSSSDVSDRLAEHLIDSLSLVAELSAQWRPGTVYLDVGSGGGFPAIPLGLALPHIPIVLIERSEKKVGFLMKAVSALDLDQSEVLFGSFPLVIPSKPTSVITARAIEKPEVFLKSLSREMTRGCSFLCQGGDPSSFFLSPSFSRRKVVDKWGQEGHRRGELWVIERR